MNKDFRTLSLSSGSLDAYIHRVNQLPMLTAEKELELASSFRNNNDLEAARQMILSHLRYVVRVARGYIGYGLPLGDLIQEGNLGLMKAVKRFDPSIGVRLVSFAVHWIKAEIHEFVIKNWRIVKMATTKAQRKLFFNLRKMKKRLGWFSREEVNAVANDLNVSAEEVLCMEQRLNAMDSPYDGPVNDNNHDEKSFMAPMNTISGGEGDPAVLLEAQNRKKEDTEKLMSALFNLDKRSRDILQARWLSEQKVTLSDLAAKYGVSAERIRQIENKAMKTLRQEIEAF